ncbi:MAG: hypothetical protein FJ279_36065, partial [Planctomycetes bacterium]|nr:hypothetical protein [Planctomycetota bacterium]
MTRRPNMFEVRALVLSPYMDRGTVAGILKAFGLRDVELADKNIQSLAGEPPARNLFADILPVLLDCLSRCADPDMALNSFERFASGSHGKVNLYSALAPSPAAIEAAVCLFSASQYFSDITIAHPEYFDGLRALTPHERVRTKDDLLKELHADLRVFSNYRHKLGALRRFKHKEMLRIGYLDLVDDAPLETVTRAISDLADVEIEG